MFLLKVEETAAQRGEVATETTEAQVTNTHSMLKPSYLKCLVVEASRKELTMGNLAGTLLFN